MTKYRFLLLIVVALFAVGLLFVGNNRVAHAQVVAPHHTNTTCTYDACDFGQVFDYGCDSNHTQLNVKNVYDTNGFKFGQLSIWISNNCHTLWTAFQCVALPPGQTSCFVNDIEIVQGLTDAEQFGCAIPGHVCSPHVVLGAYQLSLMAGIPFPCGGGQAAFHGYSLTSDMQGSNPVTTNTNTFTYAC